MSAADDLINSLIFDRTSANLVPNDPKGKYDYIDYNRVERAVQYTALEILGYVDIYHSMTIKTDWGNTDIPRTNDITRYRNNVKTIVDALSLSHSLPTTNNAVLTILGANQLEKALYDAYNVAKSMLRWSDVDNLNETWDELDAKQLKWNEYFVGQRS